MDRFETGLEVCGKPFSGNTVAGNTFSNIDNSAVFLRDGSSNKVMDNTIENSRNGIVIGSGISNEVTYNHIQRGTYGVGLWPQLSGGCNAGGATVPTIGFTFIAYNEIAKQHMAVSLASNPKLRRVLENASARTCCRTPATVCGSTPTTTHATTSSRTPACRSGMTAAETCIDRVQQPLRGQSQATRSPSCKAVNRARNACKSAACRVVVVTSSRSAHSLSGLPMKSSTALSPA